MKIALHGERDKTDQTFAAYSGIITLPPQQRQEHSMRDEADQVIVKIVQHHTSRFHQNERKKKAIQRALICKRIEPKLRSEITTGNLPWQVVHFTAENNLRVG